MFSKFFIKSDNPEIKKILDLIPGLSIVTIIFGYISYNTYAFINHLPYPIPDISIIVGLGIFNIFYLISLYILTSRNKHIFFNPYAVCMVPLLFYLYVQNYFSWLQMTILIFVGLFLLMADFFIVREPTVSYAKRRKKLRRIKIQLYITLIIYTVIGVFFVIMDFPMAMLLLFTLNLSIQFHKVKRRKKVPVARTILALLIFPSVFTISLIKNREVSLIGLSNNKVMVTLNDGQKINGELLFKTENFTYINSSDSFNLMINNSSINNMKIEKREVIMKSYYFFITDTNKTSD